MSPTLDRAFLIQGKAAMGIRTDGETKRVSARLFRSTGKLTAVDRVIQKFKELLLSRDLVPGDRIPNEKELAESFHTSRSSIREAVKTLASFGILEVKWGDGTYVSGSMSNSLFDHLIFQLLTGDRDKKKLLELRNLMEQGIVALAIANASAEDLAAMESSHRIMVELINSGVRDGEDLTEADMAFHLAIAAATHNSLVEKIYAFTLELFKPTIENAHDNKNSGEEFQYSIKLHQDILDGIKAHDKEFSCQAVAESLKTWVTLMA